MQAKTWIETKAKTNWFHTYLSLTTLNPTSSELFEILFSYFFLDLKWVFYILLVSIFHMRLYLIRITNIGSIFLKVIV
jgi:hypothetical protein